MKGEKQSSGTALLAHNSDICTMLRGSRYGSAMLRPALRREVRPIFPVWSLGKQRIYNGGRMSSRGSHRMLEDIYPEQISAWICCM